MCECCAVYGIVAADAAGGDFAAGLRQSVPAGAGGIRAGGAGRRVRRGRAGVELPRGAPGAAGQRVAHTGQAGAAWWSSFAAGCAAARRRATRTWCCTKTPPCIFSISATIRNFYEAGFGERADQPGALALLQRLPGRLAALLRDRRRDVANGPRSAAHVRLLPPDPARVRDHVSRHHRQFPAGGAAARRRSGNRSSRTICGATGARCTRAWASSPR